MAQAALEHICATHLQDGLFDAIRVQKCLAEIPKVRDFRLDFGVYAVPLAVTASLTSAFVVRVQALFVTILTDNHDGWVVFINEADDIAMTCTWSGGIKEPVTAAVSHVKSRLADSAQRLQEITHMLKSAGK